MTALPAVLVLGCSYGLLVAAKALAAGAAVTVVGRRDEVEAIGRGGIQVEVPGGPGAPAIVLDSARLPGTFRACEPEGADVAAHDLVALAMQEPQFGHPAMRGLLGRIAASGRPCLSAMNMPPPYLRRIASFATLDLHGCHAAPEAWADLSPRLLTACSPDPQAARPPGGGRGALRVGLASNLRAAPFDDPGATGTLRRLAAAINEARLPERGRRLAISMRLRVGESLFVPLSKWSVLMAGNYRAVEEAGARPIRAAVLDGLRLGERPPAGLGRPARRPRALRALRAPPRPSRARPPSRSPS